jgi:putative oxidoreductase
VNHFGKAAALEEAVMMLARTTFTVLGRELLALVFILAGLSQFIDYAETSTYLVAYNMSPLFLPTVIALEIVAGLALAFGFYTRIAATTLGIYALLDTALFMFPPADMISLVLILVQMTLAGGLIYFATHGGGRVSVDALLARKTQTLAERPRDAQVWVRCGRDPCQA